MGGLLPHPSLVVLGSHHIAVQVGEKLKGVHSDEDGSRVGLEGMETRVGIRLVCEQIQVEFRVQVRVEFEVKVVMKVVVV